jgi:hypothetical protein
MALRAPRKFIAILAALVAITLAALLVHNELGSWSARPASNPDINRYSAKYGPGWILGNWPVGQAAFVQRLKDDQKALDRGVLAYSRIRALDVGAHTVFRVTITDIGKRPQLTIFPVEQAGYVIDAEDVPTGGIMSVKAACENLNCETESPTRQAVLSAPDSGNWAWQLSAQDPGDARVLLAVTTYERNSNIAISDPSPIEITIPVRPNFSYRLKTLAGVAAGLLKWIGPGLAFAGAAAAWRWRRKRPSSGARFLLRGLGGMHQSR